MKPHVFFLAFAAWTALCNAQDKPVWIQNGDEDAVRAVVTSMADARNAHDGKRAAEAYSKDGEHIGPSRAFRGPSELAVIWAGRTAAPMKRTIQSVEFLAPGIAVVRVLAEFPNPAIQGRDVFVFVVVKDDAGWKIRVGATVPWNDGRWNIPVGESPPKGK